VPIFIGRGAPVLLGQRWALQLRLGAMI